MSTTGAVEHESEPDAGNRWASVRDVPPSTKSVVKTLDYEGTSAQSRVAEESLLPPRTVRYALSRLEDGDAVDSQFSFSDMRKHLYTPSV